MTSHNSHKIVSAFLALMLASLACQTFQPPSTSTGTPPNGTATQTLTGSTGGPTLQAPPISSNEPYEVTGTFTYSNDIITTYYSENEVALIDMYGFVTRNLEWIIPVSSQTLGFLQIDVANKTGSYSLQLPEIPTGQFADVDNNNKQDNGVQIFAVSYWPNLAGGPYSEGDDPSRGWPNYLASVRTDPENHDEVIGGNLVVWSLDEHQQFPTGFGSDGKLFTADDPVGSIPVGYSIVNLDTKPFSVSQPAKPNLTLYEPPDAAIKDFSSDSYTQAFDALVTFLRTDYAFNGIQTKQPNWDQLVTQIRPRVQKAEQNQDATAFYEALRDFTYAFKDGHVGMNGGDFFQQDFQTNYLGDLGFTARILDNGQVMVNTIVSKGPAEAAGMQTGATLTQFNGKPVMDAINAEPLFFGQQSSPFGILHNKTIMLNRAKVGARASVTFTNPGGQTQTATLTAASGLNGLLHELGYDQTQGLLPVELQTLTVDGSDIGYININSNYDDLNLIIRLFQRGLQKFQDNQVAGIIIDMRYNPGGANLGLAGFLTNQTISLGQLEYYSSTTGKFELEGVPEQVTPNVEQFHFDKMALLVGLNCSSACELEAYGFSQVPGMMVVGQYPTSGIEAEVSRGQIKMPEGISMQFPTGREVLPDGSLFLEGQGVGPTIKVPVDQTSVLSSDDVVLKAAENAILGK